MNIAELVVAATNGYKHNPLRTDQDTFEAGVLALARLIESRNSGKPIVRRGEARTVAFIPTDDYINELWEERNSSGTYLEGNLCRRDGAKLIRDLMLKGNGR